VRVGGIVLCGGQSKRMGRAKAWLPFGQEFLLPRVVRLVGKAVSPIVVVAAPEQELPSLPVAVAVVRDEEKGRGPLQGLATGLAAMEGKVEAAYVSSCDVPFLQPALVRRLIELLGPHSICVPYTDGHHHALAAVYRLEARTTVLQLLDQNRLGVFSLFENLPTRVVEVEELRDLDPSLWSLRNLNTPEEYQAALRDAGD
jgi:molybdenum cofactor guanylyltransferase